MSLPGYTFDHWIAFLPPEIEMILIYSSKCGWLSQMVNVSLFWFYGSCLKGFGSENGPLIERRKSAPGRQLVLSQQIMVCPAPECQGNYFSDCSTHSTWSAHHTYICPQTLNFRQTDRQTDMQTDGSAKKASACATVAMCHRVKPWPEPCVLPFPSLILSSLLANSNSCYKWRVKRKQSGHVCESSFTLSPSELCSISGTMQPL